MKLKIFTFVLMFLANYLVASESINSLDSWPCFQFSKDQFHLSFPNMPEKSIDEYNGKKAYYFTSWIIPKQ